MGACSTRDQQGDSTRLFRQLLLPVPLLARALAAPRLVPTSLTTLSQLLRQLLELSLHSLDRIRLGGTSRITAVEDREDPVSELDQCLLPGEDAVVTVLELLHNSLPKLALRVTKVGHV